MGLFNRKLKGEPIRGGEADWLQVFQPLHDKAMSVIHQVTESVSSNNLSTATQELSQILNQMRAAPSPKGTELKQIKREFEIAMKTYIDSCKYGIKYFEHPSVFTQTVWMETTKSAADKIEKAALNFSKFSNR